MAKPTRRAHITRDIAQHALDTLASEIDNQEIDSRARVDIACRIVDRYYDYLKALDARKPRGGTARLPQKLIDIKSAYTVDIAPTPQITDTTDSRQLTAVPSRPGEGGSAPATAGGGGTE